MSRTTENPDSTKTSRKNTARWAGAVVTLLLLLAVAATVTHNPPPQSAPPQFVTSGDLIASPAPAPAAVPSVPAVPPVTFAPKAAPQIAVLPPIKAIDGYTAVGFDRLASFPIRTKWELTDPVRIKGEQRIVGEVPAAIKALDKTKVAVEGFMLPYKVTDGLVSDFFLLRTQAKCCFGLPIQVNELLTVHMTGTGVKSLMDQPVTVYGTFHLAETRDASTGTLSAIFSVDGDKMLTPKL
ncbi:MAG TPA: hypothetical protein VFE51_00790 [Verrucomicrobiae bacterium]|nr:hypothetical protein [Verrucomicrobiae bacterium]